MAALAAGAGVAALAAGSHKNNGERAQKKAIEEKARAEYRNTERGKHEKNSKGIYYTNGNYEAFARAPILSEADWPLWQQPASW